MTFCQHFSKYHGLSCLSYISENASVIAGSPSEGKTMELFRLRNIKCQQYAFLTALDLNYECENGYVTFRT